MAFVKPAVKLASPGTTGNNTSAASLLPEDADSWAVQFVIEAVGGSPTVDFKVQGSLDDGSNWHDIPYLTEASDTVATAARTKTATGAYLIFPSLLQTRAWKHVRLVTANNTAVTYRAELYPFRRIVAD